MVLLIGWVSSDTYGYLYSLFEKNYRTVFFVAVCWVIIWGALLIYFIIKEHSKLSMVVRLYFGFQIIISILLLTAKIYYRIEYEDYRNTYSILTIMPYVIEILIDASLLIGSKKFILKNPVIEDQISN
jgi:hypothetical protein